MSEQWKLGWLESYNGYTGEPERFIYSPDRATTVCVQGQDCDEHARRIQDLLNAAEGIPTETLEAGVVVVLVEEYEALVGYAEELDEIESRMGNYSEQRAAIIRTANTRLQQNGGESK